MAGVSVTIDASNLALPTSGAGKVDVDQYVATMLDWSELMDAPWINVFISSYASTALFEDGLFPLREHLREVFAVHQVAHYDVPTLAFAISRLLTITPEFESHFSIEEVLIDQFSTEPDIFDASVGGDALRQDLARCIVINAILRKYCFKSVENHSLILRNAPKQMIQVDANLHDIEHSRDDLELSCQLPFHFRGDILANGDFDGFVHGLNESAMLHSAEDDHAVATAIKVAYFKRRRQVTGCCSWNSIPDFRIGKTFRESFKKLNPTIDVSRKTLRAAALTLEKKEMRYTHKLRKGPGGNEAQKHREGDNAGAWRRDIDTDHHLHYWRCQEENREVFEFANVSYPHDNFTIYE